MLDQSSSDASSVVSIWALSRGRVASSLEQPAVEPLDGLEADPASDGHRPEQVARQRRKLLGLEARVFEHAGEHGVGEQPHVLGEHAEHETVHEVGHFLRGVALLPERLRELRERLRGALRQRLPRLARPQPLGVGHRPLELVPDGAVGEIVQPELQRLADGVRPVRPDPEPAHVRDDQERRVLQRERVLPQLVERGVEVGVLPLVLPGEAVPLPHVRPARSAGVLVRSPLEAVVVALGVVLGRRGFAEQPA